LRAPDVDATALADAVEAAALSDAEMDYRTRLLVRDSLDALKSHWGHERFDAWLFNSPQRQQLDTICAAASASRGRPG
jgi:hypothetical protein